MELVFNNNGKVMTNSLLIAEKFERRHADVIKTIESLTLANEKVRSLYESATYIDEQGKGRKLYVMDRDGFTLLVMGFNGKKALDFKMEYISEFNKMENYLKGQSLSEYSNDPFIQLRINQIDQEKRISEVEHQVKVLEAKTHTRPEFYAVSGYAALNNIKVNMTQAATIGKKATQICKEQGIIPGDTFDPRFGKVHTYPYEILDSVFSTTINISNT